MFCFFSLACLRGQMMKQFVPDVLPMKFISLKMEILVYTLFSHCLHARVSHALFLRMGCVCHISTHGLCRPVHCILRYSSLFPFIVLCCVVLCCVVLCCVVLCFVFCCQLCCNCYAVLCSVTLCCAVVACAVMCCLHCIQWVVSGQFSGCCISAQVSLSLRGRGWILFKVHTIIGFLENLMKEYTPVVLQTNLSTY